MVYFRRVVKKRPASLTESEWVQAVERGKLPRPEFQYHDAWAFPPPDVRDLADSRILSDLQWRLGALCMAMVKPKSPSAGNGSLSSVVSPGQLFQPFSELWAFLTVPTYSDGSQREMGHMSVKCSSAGLQVTLTDPSSATYCCLTGKCLDDVFLALEIGIKENSLPWRPSGYGKGKK